MKALVTGSAGFIGSNVMRTLLEDGRDVRALCLPNEDLRNLRGLDVERVRGDVTDAPAMLASITPSRRSATSWQPPRNWLVFSPRSLRSLSTTTR
jgi:nucleoside-diphosphate-sugar epimerase